MIDFTDKIYTGSDGRKSLYDCQIPAGAKGVIIFIHGYKGFKDWGCWNLMQDFFVKNQFGFLKFNMSHNGGSTEQKMDFPDLEAFGNNTYSKELFDLKIIADETFRLVEQELGLKIPVSLLGHSRGGGIAVLHSANDKRISKVVSLAGISDIACRFPTGEELEMWQDEGVRYVYNTRTKQQMPHYFSLYEDFHLHEKLLNIEEAARKLDRPFLQVHGDMDESVSISEGIQLAHWTNTQLKIIKGGDHTFGSSHPWSSEEMPEEFKVVCDAVLKFIDSNE